MFHQGAFSYIQREGSKLKTYSTFKTTIGYENYLSKISVIKDRTSLSKLRLSNHPLMIEKGRHHQNRNQGTETPRFCPFCPGQIEDEPHFYLECQAYSRLRTDLFNEATKTVIPFPFANKDQKFNILMTIDDITPSTGRFTTLALKLRDTLLNEEDT